MTSEEPSPQSKGGIARKNRLSSEKRSEIAAKAAEVRWGKKVRKSEYTGVLEIAGMTFECAVLEDERRVVSQRGFARAFGFGKPMSMTRRGDGTLPAFLAANNLKPYVDMHLPSPENLIIPYQTETGHTAYGIDAGLIPEICNVWLDARAEGVLRPRQLHLAAKAEIVVRGLAHVGMIALVDEATGYQRIRDRFALHKILDQYIAKELLPWAKRFSDSFYQEMFRLRGWSFNPDTGKKPVLVGKLTNTIVYDKLPPGVVEELRNKNPKNDKGRRKHKHHQFLSEDVGHPHLEKHIAIVTALMRASNDWRSFLRLLKKAIPDPGGVQGELFDPYEEDEE